MKQFHYKAYDETGAITEGVLSSDSRQSAAGALQARGLRLIRLSVEGRRFLTKAPFRSRKKLALLASEWASLLEAGLLLTESLALLAGHRKGKEKEILLALANRISQGHSVRDSFVETGVFPPFFISMIQVGELTGTLPAELSSAALYYKKEDQYIRKLQAALAYPLFVLLLTLVVLVVILLFILPSFETLFDTLGIPLPTAAALGISVGQFLKDCGAYLALGLTGGALALWLYGKTASGRETWAQFLYRFSWYREMLLIRFALALSAFLESGKPLSESLADAGEVLGNPAGKAALLAVSRSLTRGDDFPTALERSGFSSPLLVELSRVGMKSGELPKFLKKAAELMGEDIEEKLNRFRAILEPALLLFVGGMTAFVIFSVMLPIFEVAGRSLG